MTEPPSYRKVNPADAPILILTLRSESVYLPPAYDGEGTNPVREGMNDGLAPIDGRCGTVARRPR